jgi:pyridoxal phosphate enzyme (YggS family)
MDTVSERLAIVREKIAQAAAKAARQADDVELVAVSKTHPPESIAEALEAGQSLFGESRVQEARVKIPLLPGRARWHFIGHLQKNKIRHALPLFDLFHGIDSLALARDLNRIADEAGAHPRILIEVNVAGEASKFGFKPDALRAQLEELLALERLQIDGLMAIAPVAPEAEASRPHFAALRELRDALERESRVSFPQLSMGMSGDYAVAVEEGATLVRVGTAIFGARSSKALRSASPGTFD